MFSLARNKTTGKFEFQERGFGFPNFGGFLDSLSSYFDPPEVPVFFVSKGHKPIMKPTPAADEMFSEGVGTYMDDDIVAGGVVVDTNREGVHSDFNNDFGDLFDDDDLA